MDFSKDLIAKQNSTFSSQTSSQFIHCPLARNSPCSKETLPSIHELGIESIVLPKSALSTLAENSPPLPAMEFSRPSEKPLPDDQQSARRSRISSLQKEKLKKVFNQSFFPTTEVRAQLAHDLGMSPRAVQIWFQNKRQAWRTKHKPGPNQTTSAFGPTSVSYMIPYFESHPYNPLSFLSSTQPNLYYTSPDYFR